MNPDVEQAHELPRSARERQCHLEAIPNERLVYAWTGGHDGNDGYGSRLDTLVTWTLSPVSDGTRLRLVHSGFVLPKNDSAFKTMSDGWKKVVQNIGAIVDEKD